MKRIESSAVRDFRSIKSHIVRSLMSKMVDGEMCCFFATKSMKLLWERNWCRESSLGILSFARMAHYTTFIPVPGYSGHIPGEKWQVGKSPANAFQLQTSRNTVISSERSTSVPRIEVKNLSASEGQRFVLTKGTEFLEVKHPDSSNNECLTDLQVHNVESATVIGEETIANSIDSIEAKLGSESEIQEIITAMDSTHINSTSDIFSKSSSKKTSSGTLSSLSSEQTLSSKQGSGKGAKSTQNMFAVVSEGLQPQNEVHKNEYIREMAPLGSTERHDIHRAVANIPIPGYSGHVPGIRDREIGKNFTMAAKECWEKYNELHP